MLFSFRVLRAVVSVMLLTAAVTYAQATSTFNGRILDQGEAVLPGVTVTVTNVSTGVARTTVTNDQGQYSVPGLETGTYEIKADLSGFAPAMRGNVRLDVNSTLTVDFRLALAGLTETLTVTGEAPLIETSQSKVANTIETTEVQNLPMITRTISGMLELLPGAAPVAPLHRTKENVGTVSYAGSLGGNVAMNVDGADNRDNHYSGPLLSFTTESLEQFQLASSQFNCGGRPHRRRGGHDGDQVRDQRVPWIAVRLRARSEADGEGFFHHAGRTAKRRHFNRQQFGGSIGGPIIQNRIFFFGAIEQQLEDIGRFVPESFYDELDVLVQATNAGQLAPGPRQS